MRKEILIGSLAVMLVACGGGDKAAGTDASSTDQSAKTQSASAEPLAMYIMDCGTIEISDLDDFSSAGDYAAEAATFADTCYLIRHPEGDLLWDLGVPSMLAGAAPMENGIYTVSLNRTITDQLIEIGLGPEEVEYVSISHQHFDHTGQVDQIQRSTWLVHEDEYASMFPPRDENLTTGEGEGDSEATRDAEANQFAGFETLETETFRGEKDVFGDGSVIIFETPGHTPGHTTLQVNLPETGPVLLTGDLYHRIKSREKQRVPRFNVSEPMTLASMKVFEDRAKRLGARVIIQHSAEDIAGLPKAPDALR